MLKRHAPRLHKGELAAMTPEAREAHLKAQASRYYNQRYKRRFPKLEGGLKECRKCQTQKTASTEFFPVNNQLKGGLGSWCLKCCRVSRTEYKTRRTYGITRAEYEALFVDAKCAICAREDTLVLDHCHNMGTPRGILCNGCNAGLGMFKDDPTVIDAAAEYLRNSRRSA